MASDSPSDLPPSLSLDRYVVVTRFKRAIKPSASSSFSRVVWGPPGVTLFNPPAVDVMSDAVFFISFQSDGWIYRYIGQILGYET